MSIWRERISPQPMFDVLSMAREREAQGNYVARMEIGDTPGFRNDYIHELVTKYSSSPYRYSPSRGEEVLISKVIETQWPQHKEENVVIGPANFLITAALASATSPGDFVLLPDPGFASYKLSADFLGLKVAYYPVYENGAPNFPNLETTLKNLKDRPKAIIINNPSNPLGVAFNSADIMKYLGNFESLGIQIILDETYINLIYDGTNSELDIPSAIRLRSFSKEHCAPGLRIGYAVAEKSAAANMGDLMSLSISCVPQFIQFAVAEYLGTKSAHEFTSNLRAEMGQRLKFVAESLPTGMLETTPNAAFYSMINMGSRGGDKGFEFLLNHNVSTCPGSKFGVNARDTVRISLAGSADTFEKDVHMLTSALIKWSSL